MKYFKYFSLSLSVLILAVGCATPQPVPFQLLDSSNIIQRGTIIPDGQRIEVVIDGQLYKGFYILGSQVAFSETLGGRLTPLDTVTTTTSNTARAHLASANGQQLNCEFLFEGKRAIGECKSPEGKVYQLSAGSLSN